jgi:hypothetical protein
METSFVTPVAPNRRQPSFSNHDPGVSLRPMVDIDKAPTRGALLVTAAIEEARRRGCRLAGRAADYRTGQHVDSRCNSEID